MLARYHPQLHLPAVLHNVDPVCLYCTLLSPPYLPPYCPLPPSLPTVPYLPHPYCFYLPSYCACPYHPQLHLPAVLHNVDPVRLYCTLLAPTFLPTGPYFPPYCPLPPSPASAGGDTQCKLLATTRNTAIIPYNPLIVILFFVLSVQPEQPIHTITILIHMQRYLLRHNHTIDFTYSALNILFKALILHTLPYCAHRTPRSTNTCVHVATY